MKPEEIHCLFHFSLSILAPYQLCLDLSIFSHAICNQGNSQQTMENSYASNKTIHYSL